MSRNEAGKLKKLKGLDLSKWSTSFWVVKRHSAQPPFRYSVLRVDVDAKLSKRLKGYVKAQIQDRDLHLEPYDFSTSDPGERLLTLDADATDFVQVAEAIDGGFETAKARTFDELLRAWAYVVLLESGDQRVFAWRKISTLNNPTRAVTRKTLFFENHRLVDLEDKQVFMIDPRIDFVVFDGTTFITNKAGFETSLGYREGMKTKGNELLEAFAAMSFLSDVGAIKAYVGDNLRHLRKLAAIQKAGYYKQPDYLARLIEVVKSEKWQLRIEAGKIVVEEESMELLLKLLNNDRLRSPINGETFDSSAKTAVASAGA